MKLSALLGILGLLLLATTRRWPVIMWAKRTISQFYQDFRAKKTSSSLYAKVVTPVGVLLIIISMYLEFTWR